MTPHNRIRIALADLPTRERSRLLYAAATAATTPEIERLAEGLAAEFEGMGVPTAREVLLRVGLVVGNGHERGRESSPGPGRR